MKGKASWRRCDSFSLENERDAAGKRWPLDAPAGRDGLLNELPISIALKPDGVAGRRVFWIERL